MSRLFGTDGVRGIANADLSPELAFRLGEAAAHFLCDRGRGRIVVGKDTRRSGDMLESALVAGICSGGADALVAGVVPTPAVALLTRQLGADGGVVVSASHNPAEYNGIKLFSRDGFKLADAAEDEIASYVGAQQSGRRPTGPDVGTRERIEDAADRYIAHAIGTIPGDLSGLRVAVDCGHGAASRTTVPALERLGAEVAAFNCGWDGTDINRDCGSTHLGALTDVMSVGGYDLGIAHDGDADRVLAVDDLGEVADGDVIMAVCAADMQRRSALPHCTVVTTVMANLGFDVAMRELGIAVVKTKVGDRYVLDEMRSTGAALGGEQSGHIIFLEHNTTGDGLVTALQLMSVMRRSGRPLSELRGVMERFPQVLVNVPAGDPGRLASSLAVSDAVRSAERRLGVKGRVLVRPSGTEPLVRVMVEAADEGEARTVAEALAAVVRSELC